jgi:demethylmenaquinone methyltransferase/2-methoxy-6-polyprenyl-1,4-benzoquinol methylase
MTGTPKEKTPAADALPDLADVLSQQRRYYDRRAAEYDDWWFRRGPFDAGEPANAEWFGDVAALQQALRRAQPKGDILELAAGTGLWSVQLQPLARTLTLVDASSEMLARNPARDAPHVSVVQADIFRYVPPRAFDAVVFTFWLSHVPRELLDAFLALVARCCAPGGTVFFADNLPEPERTAPHVDAVDGQLMWRRLKDGTTHAIVKNYYGREELESAFARHGMQVHVAQTSRFFQFGSGLFRASLAPRGSGDA